MVGPPIGETAIPERLDSFEQIAWAVHAIRNPLQERLVFVPLDGNRKVLDCGLILLAVGSANSVAFDVKQILQAIDRTGAKHFILAHNHPSGITLPSAADWTLTETLSNDLKKAGLGGRLLDHIIIDGDTIFSISKSAYETKRAKSNPELFGTELDLRTASTTARQTFRRNSGLVKYRPKKNFVQPEKRPLRLLSEWEGKEGTATADLGEKVTGSDSLVDYLKGSVFADMSEPSLAVMGHDARRRVLVTTALPYNKDAALKGISEVLKYPGVQDVTIGLYDPTNSMDVKKFKDTLDELQISDPKDEGTVFKAEEVVVVFPDKEYISARNEELISEEPAEKVHLKEQEEELFKEDPGNKFAKARTLISHIRGTFKRAVNPTTIEQLAVNNVLRLAGATERRITDNSISPLQAETDLVQSIANAERNIEKQKAKEASKRPKMKEPELFPTEETGPEQGELSALGTGVVEEKYPLVGDVVDGRRVSEGTVPNMGSIGASLLDYEILPGIREVPMSEFDVTGKHYSVAGNKNIRELQTAIKDSGEITPLIVVIDSKGPYILEGSTRIDALYNLGAKTFPAKVVIEREGTATPKSETIPPPTQGELFAPPEDAAPLPTVIETEGDRKAAEARAKVYGRDLKVGTKIGRVSKSFSAVVTSVTPQTVVLSNPNARIGDRFYHWDGIGYAKEGLILGHPTGYLADVPPGLIKQSELVSKKPDISTADMKRVRDLQAQIRQGYLDGKPESVEGQEAELEELFDHLEARASELEEGNSSEDLEEIWDREDDRSDEEDTDGGARGPDPRQLFALGTGVVKNATTVKALEAKIAPLKRRWKNGPEIFVVKTIADLPITGHERTVRGVFYKDDGTVYLVADNIEKGSELADLFHESVGHFGVRQLLGAELNPYLDKVWRSFGRTKVSKIINDYFPVGEKGRDFDVNNAEHRREVAWEKMAELAEGIPQTGRLKGLLQEFVALVRRAMRALGFNIELSNADILGLLQRSERRMATGINGQIQLTLDHMSAVGQGQPREMWAMGKAQLDSDVSWIASVISAFSGISTSEIMLRNALSTLAIEWSPEITREFNRIHGTNYAPRDVLTVDPQEIADENPDLFIATPECKRFSKMYNSKRTTDAQRKKMRAFDLASAEWVASVIRTASPPAIAFENVPDYKGSDLFKIITDALDEVGYDYKAPIVNAQDYGAAQSRTRMVLLAARKDLDVKLPDFDAVPKTDPTGWGELLGDLVEGAPVHVFGKPKKSTRAGVVQDPAETGRTETFELINIRKSVKKGKLPRDKMILTMGGSLSEDQAAAKGEGDPTATLTSSGTVARILIPNKKYKDSKDINDIDKPDFWFPPKQVTPRMMARLMGLPDSVSVPEDRTFAKMVLGNGIHGAITENFIQPLLDAVMGKEDAALYSKIRSGAKR